MRPPISATDGGVALAAGVTIKLINAAGASLLSGSTETGFPDSGWRDELGIEGSDIASKNSAFTTAAAMLGLTVRGARIGT